MECDVIVRAAKLFNAKRYFECHDVLEDAWAGERGLERHLLRALVQLAVGMYHVSCENHQGAVNLLERALDGIERYSRELCGVKILVTTEAVERCLTKSRQALVGESIEWGVDDLPVITVEQG